MTPDIPSSLPKFGATPEFRQRAVQIDEDEFRRLLQSGKAFDQKTIEYPFLGETSPARPKFDVVKETITASFPATEETRKFYSAAIERTATYSTLWETSYYTRSRGKQSHRLTTLYASNRQEAEELCVRRGLYEKLLERVSVHQNYVPVLTSCHMRKKRWANAAHACTWLCMIAVAAKVVDALDVLSDDGILHEIIHTAESQMHGHYVSDAYIQLLTRSVIEIERMTPGMWPVFSSSYNRTVIEHERSTFFDGMTEFESETFASQNETGCAVLGA